MDAERRMRVAMVVAAAILLAPAFAVDVRHAIKEVGGKLHQWRREGRIGPIEGWRPGEPADRPVWLAGQAEWKWEAADSLVVVPEDTVWFGF